METKNVSKAVISSISAEIVKHTAELRDKEFNGASIQSVEKKFLTAMGQAGASGMSELFSQNDEHSSIILEDNKRCYRKFKSTGKYLTLLGEIDVLRGLYQNNSSQKSICPLEKKLKFINDYVSYGCPLPINNAGHLSFHAVYSSAWKLKIRLNVDFQNLKPLSIYEICSIPTMT